MIGTCGDLEQYIRSAAEMAIRRCAQRLLSVETLAAQVREEWKGLSNRQEQDQPCQKLLNRIALRYCSQALFQACCSPDADTRNCAFENLRCYLTRSLQHSPYAEKLAQLEDAAEDVLQATLAILQKDCASHPARGPDDPAAFLKWTLTILNRQAYALIKKAEQEPALSLEAEYVVYEYEGYREGLKNPGVDDPEARFEMQELQQTLSNAILSLSNKRYRQVLSGTYLAEMDERELAALLGVQVQEVYLWRCRALKALRSNRKVVEDLRLWLR
ncbi:MAG TPA: sigma-70 family RNA polymerase sigma factor [Ktedonobacteraceae bacterium]